MLIAEPIPVQDASIADPLAMAPGPGLLFGLMLLAGIAGGYLAHLVRVPRVIGYLAGGVLLHTLLCACLAGDHAEDLQRAAQPLEAIQDLALGIILFTMGAVFERGHLKAVGGRILRISLVETSLVVVLVLVACTIAARLTWQAEAPRDYIALGVLLALAAVATAPAATLFVLREYGAKGPNTDTILTLTGLNNVACIVLFYLGFVVLSATGMLTTAGAQSQSPLLNLGFALLGSLLLGGVAGVLLSVAHAKLSLTEVLLLFFALIMVLGAGEKWLRDNLGASYSFLLASLTAGAIFANIAMEPQKLDGALRTIGVPIFAGFFVLAGYHLHLEELSQIGWVGAAYIIARCTGKIVGCYVGRRWAEAQEHVVPQVGAALLCQAAVVIGLSAFVQRSWDHPFAARFATVILGSIVVFELIGPLMIKRCVTQAGEVKAISLLRRTDTGRETTAAGRLTIAALGRLVGVGQARGQADPGSLQVRHIMRSSVQFLRASDTLDDLLHFIERSTHHHFPVVDEEGDFVGVVHFQDIRGMIYDPVLRDLVTAVDLADPGSAVVSPEMTLEALLEVFSHENVGTLPVVQAAESRRLVGMVEQRDLLRALHRPGRE